MGFLDLLSSMFSDTQNSQNKKGDGTQSKETIKDFSKRTGISEEVFRHPDGKKIRNNAFMDNLKKK